MQLRHLQSITQPSEGIQKVTALCWAPNGKRLAVCTTERVVLMFDEDGIRKDKFSTKPADKVIPLLLLFFSSSLPLSLTQSNSLPNSQTGTKELCCSSNDILTTIQSTCYCTN